MSKCFKLFFLFRGITNSFNIFALYYATMIDTILQNHSETFFLKIVLRKVESGMKNAQFNYMKKLGKLY